MGSYDAVSEHGVNRPEDYAGADLLNRAAAKIIDFIIVAALFELIPKAGPYAGVVYLAIADGLFDGRSAGKRIIGIRVLRKDSSGNAASCGYRESVLRNLPFLAGLVLCVVLDVIPFIGWLLSFIVMFLILTFEGLVMIGSKDGMRLGDELAGTRVVEDRQGRINV